MIKRSRQLDAASLAVRFGIGAPLTLLGPALLGILFWVFCQRYRIALPIGFYSTIMVFCAAFVPMLMLLERSTQGQYFIEAARDLTHPREIKSYGEWELNEAQATWHAYVEVALTGPRLLWEAIDQLRGRNHVSDADAALAAELVEQLRAAGAAVPVRDLIAAHRSPDEIHRAVCLLKHLDWADVSADGRRVWLRSDVAARLGR
jgi:hypothetical protein